MDLKSYFTPLLHHWWLLLAAAMVATATSFMVTLQQPPIYQTRTTMIIGRAVYEANPSSNDLWMSQQLANFYADIGMRGEVQVETMETLGLNFLPEYYIRPLPNSQLLEIVVTDVSPVRAQAVANELSNQLIRRSPTFSEQGQEHQAFINEQIGYLEGKIKETLGEIDQAEKQLTELKSARQIAGKQEEIAALQTKLSQLQANYSDLVSNTSAGAINTLSVIERAPLPGAPIGPNKTLTIALSALIATAIAAVASYLLAYLDDTLKNADDIARLLNIPVLGRVPVILNGNVKTMAKMEDARSKFFQSIVSVFRKQQAPEPNEADEQAVASYVAKNPRSLAAEEFRMLRVNLDFVGVDNALKTILITSSDPAEGKTSVASNLAVIMAQGGKKVILIDADLRKPKIHRHFGIPNNRGMSDIFRENLPIANVIQPSKVENLSIITTGIIPPNPVDLLSSKKMDQVLEQLEKISDIVIIDGPPLILPDPIVVSTKVDGVLMIVRHSYTRRGAAQTSLKKLGHVGAKILGIVLNQIPRSGLQPYGSYGYYSYYGVRDEDEPERAPAKNTV